MNSFLTEDFLKCFGKLPKSVRQSARRSYGLWKNDTSHPSLRYKRVHTKEKIYSVRVARGWRALGLVEDDTVSWFWIGSHDEYERIISMI